MRPTVLFQCFSVALALLSSAACRNSGNSPPVIDSLTPDTVEGLSETLATIRGRNFYTQVHDDLDSDRRARLDNQFRVLIGAEEIAPTKTIFIDPQTLNIVIPPGLAVGMHSLTVITPSNRSGTRDAILTVTGPPPKPAVKVLIETAAMGAGVEVGALQLTTDDTLTVFAVARDIDGIFVADVDATWLLTSNIAVLPPGPSTSVTVDFLSPGVGRLQTAWGNLLDDTTGDIVVTVGALATVNIEYGTGDPVDIVGDIVLALPSTLDLHAVGRDADGNRLGTQTVAWEVVGNVGTVSPTSAAMTTLSTATATPGGSGLVRATHAVGIDETGTISVALCDNGVLEPGEICDRNDLDGETCLSRGYLPGGGAGLACTTLCDFSVAGCAGVGINSLAGIRAAIALAYSQPGHEVISIQPGTYAPVTSIILLEIGMNIDGITLQAANSGVIFSGQNLGLFNFLFVIESPNNVIRDLQIIDVQDGMDVRGPTTTITHNLFRNATAPAGSLIRVRAAFVRIEANRVEHAVTAGLGGTFVEAQGNDGVIAMNVIYGAFSPALDIDRNARTTIAHNSIWIPGQLLGTGMSFRNATQVCLNNNIIRGGPNSTGYELQQVSAGNFAATGQCGGSSNNVNLDHQTACAGTGCPTLCNGGVLCDRTETPGFTDAELCLAPGTNALIDTAPDLGYDMVDDSPSAFMGTGPDVGARENGTSRFYGGIESTCP